MNGQAGECRGHVSFFWTWSGKKGRVKIMAALLHHGLIFRIYVHLFVSIVSIYFFSG